MFFFHAPINIRAQFILAIWQSPSRSISYQKFTLISFLFGRVRIVALRQGALVQNEIALITTSGYFWTLIATHCQNGRNRIQQSRGCMLTLISLLLVVSPTVFFYLPVNILVSIEAVRDVQEGKTTSVQAAETYKVLQGTIRSHTNDQFLRIGVGRSSY